MESGQTRTIDAIIPARDEAPTVGGVVEACCACSYVRHVIVVDDGSVDPTGELARAAGAEVVRRELADDDRDSKAEAMHEGVQATDAEAVLFVDADCLGLTPAHLDAICRPYVEGRAVMSIGCFDYGWMNRVVLRLPPTTGERVIPRWVWEAIPAERRRGWSAEMLINDVVAERRLTTVARTMHGVSHRTKREKQGPLVGSRETWRMFWLLVGLPFRGVVRWRTYWFYLRQLTVER